MSQQTIDIGTAANNGTGDPLRTGGAKINANFDELYAATGNPNLLALSGLIGAADRLPYFTGVGALSLSTLTAYSRQLLALTSASEWKGVGGLALVKADVDLSEVDNTSDVDKPVSTATQTALDGKQASSPNLTSLATIDSTAYGRDLLTLTDEVEAQGVIGLPADVVGKALLAAETQDEAQTAIGASTLGKNLIMAGGSVLSPSLGGTGVASISALLTGLQSAGAYGKTNSVGTVSQSGGIPTGAIIERGSTANGEYTKFADGTMLCSRVASLGSTAITSAFGNVYYAPAGLPALAYAMTFAAPPSVTMLLVGGTGLVWASSAGGSLPTTTAWPTSFPVSAQSQTTTLSLILFAKGRWFI